MNVAETILVFVGIPLAIVLVLAALTLLPGGRRARYRPGQPWEHAPVWYEPHPQGPADSHDHGAHAALPAGSGDQSPAVPGGPLGGARGTW